MEEKPIPPETRDAATKMPWLERLAQAKLSPLTVVGFFAVLALMSAAATGMSYLVHHLARH